MSMAWNPAPEVQALRELAAKFHKQQVIVLMVDLKAGTLQMASYGATRELCNDAKRRGELAYDAVMGSFKAEALGPGPESRRAEVSAKAP